MIRISKMSDYSFIYMRQVGYSYPMHIHNTIEYILVTNGILRMKIGQKDYKIPAGCAIYTELYEPHSFTSDPDTSYIVIESAADITPLFTQWLMTHTTDDRVVRFSDELIAYLQTLLPPPNNTREEQWNISHIRAKTIVGILTDLFVSNCNFKLRSSKYDDAFTECLHYCYANFDKEITVSSAAKHVGMNPDSLSKKFFANTGMTIGSFIQKLRVNQASELLRNGMSVSTAAFRSGFGSMRSFYRIFKQITGLTPSDFRKECCTEDPQICALYSADSDSLPF